MRVQIRCRTKVSLRRLVPAFPMQITALCGQHILTRRGFSHSLREGQSVSISPFESVDLHLSGGLFSPAACHLELSDAMPEALEMRALVRSGGTLLEVQYLRDLLSGTVFHHPQREWNAHVLATALQTTPSRIRTALFKQGAAFTQICRTQRLMRALFESMQFNLSVSDLMTRIGWTDHKDLEASFYDWFGVSLQTVSRLREDCL